MEYKTAWAADLQDLPAFFAKAKTRRTLNERQSIEALEQLYGYMTFNNNRYGILSNWTCTWALCVETIDRKTLEYAGPFMLPASATTFSMLKVFVGIVLLAEFDWSYASPTPNPPSPTRFFSSTRTGHEEQRKAVQLAGNYESMPIGGLYPLLPLDFRLCDFAYSLAHSSEVGCIVPTHLHRDVLNKPYLATVCKVVDAIHRPAASDSLKTEAGMYAALQRLQGDVIPKVYGYYQVWGILHLLTLEPVGNALQEGSNITSTLRRKMK